MTRLTMVLFIALAATSAGCASVPRAAYEGDTTQVRAYLAGGGAVDARGNDGGCDGCTLLHLAAVGGREEVARELLDRGADPNAVAGHGLTPLHYAAGGQSAGVVRLLLARGATRSLEARDEWGNTPLLRAAGMARPASEPSPEIIEALAAAGADVNAVTSKGNTPLHIAAYKGFAGTVRLLLSKGADPSRRNAAGETAEALAAKLGRKSVVEVLRRSS
ncbi:MAG TPA: ankyrin repeat domain-containing protein [Anaeromyxobacteraceae bacterium]|nr:ankyrin repeat domain-containing protein [Anaeromyxobacteraceae bacterium]